MNRNFFSKISVAAVSCMALLAIIQCYWIVMVYNDQENDFKRRVESAAYKSVYKVFRNDAIPGIEIAEVINIDIEAFDLVFTANLLELDIIEPYFAEIIENLQQVKKIFGMIWMRMEMKHLQVQIRFGMY